MPHRFTAIPNAPAFRLVNARVPQAILSAPLAASRDDGLAPCEILLTDGRIAAIGPVAPANAGDLPMVDLRNGIVLPRFVDPHTHIDKGHIAQRSPNPDGTFLGARNAVAADREAHWAAADVRARMDFSLRCAFAHGTGALRTHIDSLGKQAAISWPVFAEMRETWRDRIALQAVALFPYDMVVDDEPQFKQLLALVVRHGGVLGGLTHMGGAPDAKLSLALDRLIAAASANGLDLDFHVDESAAPEARSLEEIANSAIRHRFAGRIVAGHCCSLALADESDRTRIIERVGEAGIAVVSLPMCNMYLQDRQAGRTPRWRGVAPLHELDAAGIAVMVASDNTRDPFYAYGDLDMIEVFREATRILQLDHSNRPWTRLFGATAAEVMGLPGRGLLTVGGPADLVLTDARTIPELVTRPQSDRIVLVGGLAIGTRVPDYRELDALQSPTQPNARE
jgi:cytosine deaminase